MKKYINAQITSTPHKLPPKLIPTNSSEKRLEEDKFIVVKVKGKKIQIF